MNKRTEEQDKHHLQQALKAASDTRVLIVDAGASSEAERVFSALWGTESAIIVADENTFEAAGRVVHDTFLAADHLCDPPFLFERNVYAEYKFVECLEQGLKQTNAFPIAVGSGTINDLTKLVAHRLGRPYMVVGTAASVDGYTAYGASITYNGSKQTFSCPAPRAVLADLDVIARAPEGMNASGYADLLAKCAAGTDWILADAAGAEAINPDIWGMMQERLRSWVGDPQGVARGRIDSLRHLIYGLMMSGFAMQASQSSRPASGADHQFSHLWDMQHHEHEGKAPSHGFKVGIGTLASLALHGDLLDRDFGAIDIERCVRGWPSLEELESRITTLFDTEELTALARQEMQAKYCTRDALRVQLLRLREQWPELRLRLKSHLLPFGEARDMLREAGCPFEPEQIGISRDRLRLSYRQSYYIRRRFTVLDFVERFGLTDSALINLFNPSGPWGTSTQVMPV